MGASNRTKSLERKIALLLGERDNKLRQIERAMEISSQIPDLEARVDRIGELLHCCEEIIRDDQPDWTPQHIKSQKPFHHQIPIPMGQCIKMALDVLRVSGKRMIVRDIAEEVLAIAGVSDPDDSTITKVAGNIGNQFRKGDRPYLECDDEWPKHWWVTKPE